MSDETVRENWLRRLLVKTKPVTYPLWMAGLATILTMPMVLAIWAAHPTLTAETVLVYQLFFSCLGALMGLFATRLIGLPWLATFGDVVEAGSQPAWLHAPGSNAQFVLLTGFALALAALVAITFAAVTLI